MSLNAAIQDGLSGNAIPAVIIGDQLDGPVADLPRRLLTALVETWDDPDNRPTLLAIAQAGGAPESSALTRGFVEGVLAGPISKRLRDEGVTPEDASRCTALLVTQLVGVIYARYVLAADPVATTPKQAFIDGLTPALNAVLDQCIGRRGDPAD